MCWENVLLTTFCSHVVSVSLTWRASTRENSKSDPTNLSLSGGIRAFPMQGWEREKKKKKTRNAPKDPSSFTLSSLSLFPFLSSWPKEGGGQRDENQPSIQSCKQKVESWGRASIVCSDHELEADRDVSTMIGFLGFSNVESNRGEMETTCRAMHELGVCAREEDGILLNTELTAT